ncbi:EamA-like transporter family protein [Cohaesibacter sp. ES.047]|uniref:DMT family transporter n=1 Tax=Cohaesibacter sp. ES.047 TaxID=1798205 RepID=UPI000BB920DA|nr:DMT family transporter [Cohaesibacter sp. ES.047]SNY94135.1 EamA-like transporter family protein [Cohaesibacter sp. ES.047]
MSFHEKGLAYLLVASALMSLDAVFIRLSGLHGFAPSFLFGFFSLVSMTSLTRWREGPLVAAVKASGPILILSGAIMGVSGTAFVLAVQNTTVANVLLIMSLSPFFSALFSWILLQERITTQTALATLLSIGGMYIIVQGSLASDGVTGDILAVICTMAVSLNFVVYRKYPKLSRSLAVAAGGFFIALFASFFIETGDFDTRGILIMMIMGLFSAPVGRMLMAMATRLMPAPEVSLISQVKVAIAPAIMWLVFAEVPNQATFMGGSLILLAALGHPLLTLYRNRQKPAQQT